ncbi:kinesin-like protein KIN-12B [Juglans regia]|uniref:Kinesin-like protein KIN-12B n=2 Tax=Juglans regia TaxID=51240 RepID=A0A6P9DUC0_JUGRE|nr:kinesin-like protein KIN-12B [Juglans regia]XP_035539115.1 kinesin-like protein KIN-12B [Juglans regia]
MKHYMQPKNPILREMHSADLPSSPSPSSTKPRPSRKTISAKENALPPDPNFMQCDSKQSPAKFKSPLPPRPPSSNPLKRKLIMETVPEISVPGASDSGVKVIVRVRPPYEDRDEGDIIVQKSSRESLSINGQTFTFDSVADIEATQQDIFQLVGAPLVENCLAGFNSSVFAYGQTGSGKTYTMWGPANALLQENLSSDQQGLTPRVFEQLFARIIEEQIKHADKQLEYQCYCSFLEIYNEQITDLLDPNQRNLQVREDVKSGVYVENLKEESVCTMKDVTLLLIKGLSNRRTGATSINAESSRSHTVFTCVVESRCKSKADALSCFKTSRINLVDLAGSERQKLTGAAGERLKEAGNINRSLSQLGNLINILAEVSQTGKQRHIPYRDSRLTFLLQESLGGNSKLAMVCAVSPSQGCKSETFSTLRFAQRAKAIKNKAVVNEVMQNDVNHLRKVIRQLRDELDRYKANRGYAIDSNGGNSAAWIRRSLNLLKSSLNCPVTLTHVDNDGDEEMEIDEEAVERLCVQVDKQIAYSETNNTKNAVNLDLQLVDSEDVSFNVPQCYTSGGGWIEEHSSEDTDVSMEGASDHDEMMIFDCADSVRNPSHSSNANVLTDPNLIKENHRESNVLDGDPSWQPAEGTNILSSSLSKFQNEESPTKNVRDNSSCSVSELNGVSSGISSAEALNDFPNGTVNCVSPSLSIVPSDVSPVLKSPIQSVSPRICDSRKSLRTSSMLTASQKDPQDDKKLGPEAAHIFKKSMRSNTLSAEKSKNFISSTEHLAASIHHGLEIIDSHRQSSALRQSSFRFSLKPTESKPVLPVEKVDMGVQTSIGDTIEEDSVVFMCTSCKNKMQLEATEADDSSNLQLVPVDGSEPADKLKKHVPKAVEKVLAGAIRREMALEDFCAMQTSEIVQLNCLMQQYKHERECNAIIAQTREDKILRLENLMDGFLPTEEFLQEELVSLTQEHKILKEKYENHPDVLRTKINLKRVEDELEHYRNFYDMGEKEVLMEEIQNLRSQLQFYIDSSSISCRRQNPPPQLTYSCQPHLAPPLTGILESTVSAEEKLEQERIHWTEAESRWISLSEELRTELEASRSLTRKTKQELETERKCAEELKEAMQMAIEGHARILELYADLEEKHIQLLARHRMIREGIEDVKKAAAKAGVKGAESKFINALAAEISALRVEREKERRYYRDENKGLQAQLRDTAEAVQAAGELLVRLTEAEEAVVSSQKRAMEAEQETEEAHKQVDRLKKKHEKEISALNELLTESRLPREAIRPVYDDTHIAKYDTGEAHIASDQRWREEFDSFYNDEDGELPKLTEPSSWYSGYDRCNI